VLSAVALLAASACSQSEPAATVDSTTSTAATNTPSSPVSSRSAEPAETTVDVPEDGVEYVISAGTVSAHCDGEVVFTGQRPTAPRVFDTQSGSFKTAALPAVPLGEELRTSQCTVTRDRGQLKVAYVVSTQKPASGLEPVKEFTRAYVMDLEGPSPRATIELPPGSEMRGSSSFGVPVMVSGGGQTRIDFLRPTDLSRAWTKLGEPSYAATPSAIAVYGATDPAVVDIVDSESGNTRATARITEQLGSQKLRAFTDGFKVSDRVIRSSDAKSISVADDSTSTGGDSQLSPEFFMIRNASLLRVYDLNSGRVVIDRRDDDAKALDLRGSKLFGDKLYLLSTSSAGVDTKTIVQLPSQKTVATSWTEIPYADLDGWTLTTSNCMSADLEVGAACEGLELVKDVAGQYPAPTGG
jgi:hypothetical protein